MTTPTPNDPVEARWAYLNRELLARGRSQRDIDEMREEDAWRFLNEHAVPPQANGHAPETPSTQPEQGRPSLSSRKPVTRPNRISMMMSTICRSPIRLVPFMTR